MMSSGGQGLLDRDVQHGFLITTIFGSGGVGGTGGTYEGLVVQVDSGLCVGLRLGLVLMIAGCSIGDVDWIVAMVMVSSQFVVL